MASKYTAHGALGMNDSDFGGLKGEMACSGKKQADRFWLGHLK